MTESLVGTAPSSATGVSSDTQSYTPAFFMKRLFEHVSNNPHLCSLSSTALQTNPHNKILTALHSRSRPQHSFNCFFFSVFGEPSEPRGGRQYPPSAGAILPLRALLDGGPSLGPDRSAGAPFGIIIHPFELVGVDVLRSSGRSSERDGGSRLILLENTTGIYTLAFES